MDRPIDVAMFLNIWAVNVSRLCFFYFAILELVSFSYGRLMHLARSTRNHRTVDGTRGGGRPRLGQAVEAKHVVSNLRRDPPVWPGRSCGEAKLARHCRECGSRRRSGDQGSA